MCDLKRQQISLGTRHRNSQRTWIANLLYRFTGRLILEGWHRASDISSSAEGLNKKDLFLPPPARIRAAATFLFLYSDVCAPGTKSFSSFISFSFMSHPSVYIFFSSSQSPPSLENAWFRSETNPANSDATAPRSKKELVIESVIIVQGFFFYLSFLQQSCVYVH